MKKEKHLDNYFIKEKNGKYHIYCSICGEIAATIDIYKSNYSGIYKKDLKSDFNNILIKWLQSKSISELDYDIKNHKILDFGIDVYCRDCRKVYCAKHWETIPVFEDNGWYDYGEATCPKGHTKMIDD